MVTLSPLTTNHAEVQRELSSPTEMWPRKHGLLHFVFVAGKCFNEHVSNTGKILSKKWELRHSSLG